MEDSHCISGDNITERPRQWETVKEDAGVDMCSGGINDSESHSACSGGEKEPEGRASRRRMLTAWLSRGPRTSERCTVPSLAIGTLSYSIL